MIRKIGIIGKLIASVPILVPILVFGAEYEIKHYAPKAEKVMIAGEFNEWNPEEFRMERIDGGYFSRKLELEPGVYEYKVIIDGEWLDGGNLKYDTAQRRTIIISNFAWSPKIFWRGKFLVNISSSGAESYHSFQGDITLNNKVSGMFIIGYTGIDDRLTASAEKLSIVFREGIFNVNSFYNLRVFQSTDPMRLLKRASIPLRQREIVFFDESNPAEDYGLGIQGILAKFESEGIAGAKVLLGDDYDSEEDIIFAQAGVKGFNAQYLSRKGIQFPFASEWNWFPDPDQPPTWQGNQSVQPWYKGFNEESVFSLDTALKRGRADFFCQYALKNKMLRSSHWNEGGSGYAAYDKIWRFYEAGQYMAGVKYKGQLSAQFSYASERGKFSEFWDQKTKSDEYCFSGRFNFGQSYIGAKALMVKNHIPVGYDVYESFDPFHINYYYGQSKRYGRWREHWFIGDFRGRSFNLKFVGKMYPEEEIKQAVITAEKNISLFVFKFSPQYFSDGSNNYLCSSLSMGIKKGALTLEFGAGMSPGDFALIDESDRREDFLYNESDRDAGYKLLKKRETIWLRAVLGF